MSRFSSKLIGDGVGAEVLGDLTDTITSEDRQDLRRLLNEHFLLVFRGQNALAEEQQDALMSSFGNVIKQADGLKVLKDLKEGDLLHEADVVSNIDDLENNPEYVYEDEAGNSFLTAPLAWHNDAEFLPDPYTVAALYALDVVDDASATDFANGARAYRLLPQDLKERIEDLDALHVDAADYSQRNRLATVPENHPRFASPLADAIAETGTRFLSLAELFVDSIVGLPEGESETLIGELLGYLHAPENYYSHSWRSGDLVIWDNRVMQHRRPQSTANVGRRVLRRSSLGPKTLTQQYAEWHQDFDREHASAGAK